MWVIRTADSVLLTCWPPAPDERYTSVFRSAGLMSISMLSSTSGETNTEVKLVCRRLSESNGLLRTSRCTPISVLRSEEHTSELQSLMRISYAVFCLKKKIKHHNNSQLKHTHKTYDD